IGLPNPLATHIDFLSRPAWLGYTTSGDECSVRIHEWVNPYPELTVKSVEIFYPKTHFSGERTAILAITGIETEEQDVARWSRKARPPLRPAAPAVSLEGMKPIVAGGKPETVEIKSTRIMGHRTTNRYVDEKSNVLFSVQGANEGGRIFNDDSKSCRLHDINSGKTKWSVKVKLAKPARIDAIAFRGRFMTWKERGDVAAGTYKLARANYEISAKRADGSWQKIGMLPAACGEDGTYLLKVATLTTSEIKVDVDATDFHDLYYGYYNAPGFSYLQAYAKE
ncbi:MAG: hypothetical protein QF886_22645, partial [Planctomycetota bacterium]|nr:hypothetical protein [Planctomycetota bacterium]